MPETSVNILGIDVSSQPAGDLIPEIETLLQNAKAPRERQIVTINPLIFNEALNDGELYGIIKRSFKVVADSVGVKVLGFLYFKNIRRIRGIDLLGKLLGLASDKGFSVYFIGSSEENISAAVRNIKDKHPGLIVKGHRSGYFNESQSESVIAQIANASADMLFVGLGTPEQELWIGKNLHKFNCRLVMGVGGSFDVISGKLKSAPRLIKLCGLEWLFRAVQQPFRLRRIIKIPVFLLRALLIRLHVLKLPFGD